MGKGTMRHLVLQYPSRNHLLLFHYTDPPIPQLPPHSHLHLGLSPFRVSHFSRSQGLSSVCSQAPSDHLPLANEGSSPCTLTQVHGKPMSSVCTTSVCGSGIMTSSLTSKMSQPSRPSLACGTDYSYVPFQSVSDGRASSVPVTLPMIPEMTVPRGPPPLIPFTAHDVAGLTPHIDSHVVSPHRATANAAMPVQVTNQDAPMHVGLSPSAYITTPLVRTRAGVAHTQTVVPGLNTPTCAVAPGIPRLVTSSDVEPRVRVTDHYQMPSLAPPTVYTTPASSLPTALTGVTHAPVGSI